MSKKTLGSKAAMKAAKARYKKERERHREKVAMRAAEKEPDQKGT